MFTDASGTEGYCAHSRPLERGNTTDVVFMCRTLFELTAIALFAQLLNAQTDPWRSWNVSKLLPGREVTVETFQPKRKLKGTFAGRDAETITLKLKSGTSQIIARETIRKVTAIRKT